MTVRGARLEDARAIARIHVDGWRAAYRGILPDDVLAAQSVDRREGQWREWIPLGRALVAEHDGEVVGFAGVIAETGEIAALYVDPGHWRRGAGRALARASMAQLRDAGCDHAALWVFEENDGARAFYAALGFRPDGAVDEVRHGVRQLRLVAGLDSTL
jgi:GNAT superfamily N-acetyltransferase